jgi:hypothetical protein
VKRHYSKLRVTAFSLMSMLAFFAMAWAPNGARATVTWDTSPALCSLLLMGRSVGVDEVVEAYQRLIKQAVNRHLSVAQLQSIIESRDFFSLP